MVVRISSDWPDWRPTVLEMVSSILVDLSLGNFGTKPERGIIICLKIHFEFFIIIKSTNFCFPFETIVFPFM